MNWYVGNCKIKHEVIDDGGQDYDAGHEEVLEVDFMDNDKAQVFLRWNGVNEKLNFLGPLTLGEGDTVEYGIQLATRPTEDIYLNITDLAGILTFDPPALFFTPDNKCGAGPEMSSQPRCNNSITYVKVSAIEDDIDHILDKVGTKIFHAVASADRWYSELMPERGEGDSTVVSMIVQVVDNDQAGVNILNGGAALVLNEGFETTVIIQSLMLEISLNVA